MDLNATCPTCIHYHSGLCTAMPPRTDHGSGGGVEAVWPFVGGPDTLNRCSRHTPYIVCHNNECGKAFEQRDELGGFAHYGNPLASGWTNFTDRGGTVRWYCPEHSNP